MRRIATAPVAGALLGAALAVAPVVASAGPRGRVIRIERTAQLVIPRLCAAPNAGDATVCFGQPHEGEHIAMIDLGHGQILGDLVVTSVSESTELATLGLCVDEGASTVRGTYVRGGATGASSGGMLGLRGAKHGPRARVLPNRVAPSGRAEETVQLTLDADGDARPDLVLTHYPCDGAGQPAPSADSRCFDTYVAGRAGLARARQDIVKTCP